MFDGFRHAHFVGIGGSGMSGIAEVMLSLGYRVSGSDLSETDVTRRLRKLGAVVRIGHSRGNLGGCNVVVTSTAVSQRNPEVLSARARRIPVIPRAEMLAELMRLKYSICVAGCHGKTTTTSMVAGVLACGGLDPTAVIGGRFNNLGTGGRLGRGEYIVAEADESDGSFLKYTPTFAVITNIDNDHLDYFGSVAKIQDAFVQFAGRVPFYGAVFACADDPLLSPVLKKIGQRKIITYSTRCPADFSARNIRFGPDGCRFEFWRGTKKMGALALRVAGRHNVANATVAAAVGTELGVPIGNIRAALLDFRGVGRRLEKAGAAGRVVFIDDYAHHPTELAATLSALRQMYPGRRVVAIFQPHRYTRTKFLHARFGPAFRNADVVKLEHIYPAGEKPLPGVSAELIYRSLKKHRPGDRVFGPSENISEIAKILRSGDVVVTLGAGDVWKAGIKLIEMLRGRG